MRKSIRTFVEDVVEHHDGVAWKQVSPAEGTMDKTINEWAVSVAAEIIDVKVFDDQNSSRTVTDKATEQRRSRRYVVVYETENQIVEALPLEPVANATAPTVEVDMIEGTLKRKANAMAGIFGVPEGFYLAAQDPEPALTPLFSPDVKLEKYETLFGNLKHA